MSGNKQSIIGAILRSPQFWAAVLSLLQITATLVEAQLVRETEDIKQQVIELHELVLIIEQR